MLTLSYTKVLLFSGVSKLTVGTLEGTTTTWMVEKVDARHWHPKFLPQETKSRFHLYFQDLLQNFDLVPKKGRSKDRSLQLPQNRVYFSSLGQTDPPWLVKRPIFLKNSICTQANFTHSLGYIRNNTQVNRFGFVNLPTPSTEMNGA